MFPNNIFQIIMPFFFTCHTWAGIETDHQFNEFKRSTSQAIEKMKVGETLGHFIKNLTVDGQISKEYSKKMKKTFKDYLHKKFPKIEKLNDTEWILFADKKTVSFRILPGEQMIYQLESKRVSVPYGSSLDDLYSIVKTLDSKTPKSVFLPIVIPEAHAIVVETFLIVSGISVFIGTISNSVYQSFKSSCRSVRNFSDRLKKSTHSKGAKIDENTCLQVMNKQADTKKKSDSGIIIFNFMKYALRSYPTSKEKFLKNYQWRCRQVSNKIDSGVENNPKAMEAYYQCGKILVLKERTSLFAPRTNHKKGKSGATQ